MLGPSVLGLKQLKPFLVKSICPEYWEIFWTSRPGTYAKIGNAIWDFFDLVHIWNILRIYTLNIFAFKIYWTSRPAKNAKIRIVLCSSLWAMELEKAISHWQAHLLLSSPFFPQIYFLYRDPVTIFFTLKMPFVWEDMVWDEVSVVLGKLGYCKSGPGKLGPWKMSSTKVTLTMVTSTISLVIWVHIRSSLFNFIYLSFSLFHRQVI